MSLSHSPSLHSSLIARIPVVTGRDLAEWFHRLESGPAFLRREERAHWLADEAGISCGYAYACGSAYPGWTDRRPGQRRGRMVWMKAV